MYKIRRKILLLIVFMLSALLTNTTNAQPHLNDGEIELLRTVIEELPDCEQKLSAIDKMATSIVNLDSMMTYSIMEMEISDRLGNHDYKYKAYDRLGWCCALKGSHEDALKYYRMAKNISDSLGNYLNFAKSLSGIGDALLGLGRFETGIDYKNKALNILKKYDQLSDMAIIYRSLGKASLDYLQYQMAMDNFNNALKIDMAIDASPENTRNTGRDYHFIGRTTYIENDLGDMTKLIEAKNLLLIALQYHEKAEDYLYTIHSCMTISMIYANMVFISKKWDYADSSMLYYNIGKQTKVITGYQRYYENYDLVHALHLALTGDNQRALEILNKYKNKEDLDNDIKVNLYRCYDLYYQYNRDWKGVLENRSLEYRNWKAIYISEFFRKVSKINVISDLEYQIQEMDDNYEISKSMMEQSTARHMEAVKYATIIIFMMMMLVVSLLITYFHDRFVNKSLKLQESKLRQVNNELTDLYNATKEQSEEIKAQTTEMKRQRNKLSTYNFKMMIHLGIGKRMQSYIVPPMETVRSIFPDSFIMWRPLEEVSGDFYWCSEANGYKIVAVADCTGHGIPGAFLSMLGVALLNSIVPRMGHDTNAAKILDRLRERVEELMRRGSNNNEVHDGMDIAICMFCPQEHRLHYAGAYRPLWMVRDGDLTEFKADKMPVAIDEDRKGKFTNHQIETRKGDMFYMFSDGITDQYGTSPSGKKTKFKAKRLREFVETKYALPPDAQRAELEQTINQWSGPHEQTDDIMFFGIMEQ